MNKRKSSKRKNFVINFINNKNYKNKSLSFFGLSLIIFLIFFYIFQVTEMTKDVHLIQFYEKEINNVLEDNRKNEYGFLKSNSVIQAEELVQELNYVKIEQVYYIDASDYQVASK